MEEQFQLKQVGKLSIFEQNNMVAEDRAWWYERLKKYLDEQHKNKGK